MGQFKKARIAYLKMRGQTLDKRASVLDTAYTAHPERFVGKPPEPPQIPETSWINRPDQPEEKTQ